MARSNDVHAFGYNSAGSERIWISERIWMKFGELRVYCLELPLTNFGCDPLNNARFHRLPVDQISRNLHKKTHFRVRMWGFGKHLWKFARNGFFFPKPPFLLDQSQQFPTSGRDFSEMITNLGRSWQVGTPVECWLSIDTVGINSKWFPWSVARAHGEQFFSPKILFYVVYRRRLHGMLHNAERCK